MFHALLNYGSWYRLIASGRIRRCSPGTIKEFSIEFLNEQSSEPRSTQNLNFNLTVIKSKVVSRSEPCYRFKQLPNQTQPLKPYFNSDINKSKVASTFINARGLRSTQNLKYNSTVNKSKVGILRTFSSTYLTSTNRKASIAQTTIKVKLFQKLKKGNFLSSTTEATSLTRPPIKVKAARVSPGSLLNLFGGIFLSVPTIISCMSPPNRIIALLAETRFQCGVIIQTKHSIVFSQVQRIIFAEKRNNS